MRDDTINECPVSYITAESAELVRKYHQARRQNTTLSKMLRTNSVQIEDTEEVLDEARLAVKAAWAEERNKNA